MLSTTRLPDWLRRPPASAQTTTSVRRVLRFAELNTVCEEARCPNISECFSRGTATFMILGDVCTRGCKFCSVKTGTPSLNSSQFAEEARSLAETAAELNLRHIVITSVARDDLEDGGASGFAAAIRAVHERLPKSSVEVLIPDFRGSNESLKIVLDATPQVLNHNLETVPRLYRRVRPGANYLRSLRLLSAVSKLNPSVTTKTGIMLGLGERKDEVIDLMRDARSHGVRIFTAGQYMRPTKEHLPVERYLELTEFDDFQAIALELGFDSVAVGPLVRSSYNAEALLGAGV